jgi:hypothetical protein
MQSLRGRLAVILGQLQGAVSVAECEKEEGLVFDLQQMQSHLAQCLADLDSRRVGAEL